MVEKVVQTTRKDLVYSLTHQSKKPAAKIRKRTVRLSLRRSLITVATDAVAEGGSACAIALAIINAPKYLRSTGMENPIVV